MVGSRGPGGAKEQRRQREILKPFSAPQTLVLRNVFFLLFKFISKK